MRTALRSRSILGILAPLALAATSAASEGSVAALHFHGTGTGQLDRARFRLDDDAPGVDASAPSDIGQGSFTLQFWVRGTLGENATSSSAAQGSYGDARWLAGNCVLDRGVPTGTGRWFGVSLAGGRVRFGTGPGDGPVLDPVDTLEGDALVLDGLWHHVSVSRDVETGHKTIFVDAQLDVASASNVSRADLSYPDGGVPGSGSAYASFLVLGAAKDDVGSTRPPFHGRIDELHVWNRRRRGAEVAADMLRPVPVGTSGLVAAYRFEEGTGTVLHDTSGAGSPDGVLVAGVAGNGEWSLLANGTGEVAPVVSPSLPDGFTRQVLVAGLIEPTDLTLTPDGRVLVAQRLGVIRVVRDGALLATPALTMTVGSSGERGLLGITCDPDFATNGWIYVYACTLEPRNQVVRYTLNGDVADPASAFVVWQDGEVAGSTHQGGGLAFAADGNLLLGVGEHGASASSFDLASEHGKVLRFAKNGTIPADNPFLGVPGARPTIFARGFRNPFRLVVDALTGAVWVGDVGGNSPSAQEELNRILPGGDYGWPRQEGTACYSGPCTSITYPAWSYRHDDVAIATVTGSGCIVAGDVYRGTQFPAEYRGNLFVGDYANRWLRRLEFDAAGNVTAATVFDPQPGAGPIIDVAAGPDGALYTLTYGFGGLGNPDGAQLGRIAWTGANAPPVAIATATNIAGQAPLVVQFQGSLSNDPDLGPAILQFHWDFGDGTTASSPDPRHVYASQGPFTARLTLNDGAATTVSAPIEVRVGTSPVVTLFVPAAAGLYRAGDVITFQGSAVDAEDGPLAASAFTAQVLLVHLEHEHPFLGPLLGTASGAFQVPTSGHAPAHTHYQVRVVAVDSSGLDAERTVEVHPRIAKVVLTAKPAGIALDVDGEGRPTPYAYEGLAAFQHRFTAPLTAEVNEIRHEFERWMNGRTGATIGVLPVLDWTTPDLGGMVVAVYRPLERTTAAILAAPRNAQYDAAHGVAAGEFGAPQRIAFGRDAGGRVEAGFTFRLPIPRNARIVAARIEGRAATFDVAALRVRIRAYAAGVVPPFTFGSTVPLSSHAPIGPPAATWEPSAFLGGEIVATPDLAALVRAVVARPDWNAGQTMGFVFDSIGDAQGLRRFENFASGSPPRIVVDWAPEPPVSGH